jgi:apolipoprotein D and lipocalin family protein
MQRNKIVVAVAAGVAAALLAACASGPGGRTPRWRWRARVDLARFMGDWHVIAAIPTVFERNAHNPVDRYRLDPDGTVATTFSFNDGAFDGARKEYASRGFVVAGTGNAVWGQQYVWPIRADYRIAYLAADYSQVVVAREKRDYVWIMARTPTIAAADLERLTAFVAAQGYDTSRLRRMPQAGGR